MGDRYVQPAVSNGVYILDFLCDFMLWFSRNTKDWLLFFFSFAFITIEAKQLQQLEEELHFK